MDSGLFLTGSFPVLEKTLDAVALRHQAIADNIANVNTPNYKKKGVSFEEELKMALYRSSGDKIPLSTTNPKHIAIGGLPVPLLQPQVKVDNSTLWRKDGNNVDIDVEMAEMSKNTIKYESLTQRINQEFSMLKRAIEGR